MGMAFPADKKIPVKCSEILGFRDSLLVRKLRAETSSKTSCVGSGVPDESSIISKIVLNLSFTILSFYM